MNKFHVHMGGGSVGRDGGRGIHPHPACSAALTLAAPGPKEKQVVELGTPHGCGGCTLNIVSTASFVPKKSSEPVQGSQWGNLHKQWEERCGVNTRGAEASHRREKTKKNWLEGTRVGEATNPGPWVWLAPATYAEAVTMPEWRLTEMAGRTGWKGGRGGRQQVQGGRGRPPTYQEAVSGTWQAHREPMRSAQLCSSTQFGQAQAGAGQLGRKGGEVGGGDRVRGIPRVATHPADWKAGGMPRWRGGGPHWWVSYWEPFHRDPSVGNSAKVGPSGGVGLRHGVRGPIAATFSSNVQRGRIHTTLTRKEGKGKGWTTRNPWDVLRRKGHTGKGNVATLVVDGRRVSMHPRNAGHGLPTQACEHLPADRTWSGPFRSAPACTQGKDAWGRSHEEGRGTGRGKGRGKGQGKGPGRRGQGT